MSFITFKSPEAKAYVADRIVAYLRKGAPGMEKAMMVDTSPASVLLIGGWSSEAQCREGSQLRSSQKPAIEDFFHEDIPVVYRYGQSFMTARL